MICKSQRRRKLKTILLTFTLLLALFSPSFSQQNSTRSIHGFVYDGANKEALIGVNVYFPDLLLGSSTNKSGYYIISNLPQGTYTLIVEYLGYETYIQKIKINSHNQKIRDIYLQMTAIQGETVEVVADSIRTSIKLYEKPISNIQLTPKQLNSIPQVAETDLLRSLQTLPGILPVSDYSSALYVRGGTPDQNLYLLDGTDVYNPEHAFGIFSTFNTDAIKHVDISKGGFGAKYGGRLSSVLDVINLDGNREQFEGQASISLLSAKTTLQMPVGNIGAISGSIRRTYFDKTLRNQYEEIPDYYFYDGNIKGFFELDAKNKITISAYGGRDKLHFIFNTNSTEEQGFDYDWGNTTGSVRWTRVFNPKLFANFWITGSRFSSNFDLGETIPVVERNYISDITLKGDLEYHYSQYIHVKFGFEQKNIHMLYEETFPGGSVDVDFRPEHYVGYGQLSWLPSARWEIEAGLRYNYFDSDRNFQNMEPRLSLKYRLTTTVNLKLAGGIYTQYLHHIPRSFVTDIWSVTNQYQDPASASHYIAGFQKEIGDHFSLEVETYYKNYNHIHSFNPNFITQLRADDFDENGNPIYTETRGLFNSGSGDSYGFEVLLRKDVGILTGWIGYTYAQTKYKIDGVNRDRSFPPRHDRRSTINIISNIDIRNYLRLTKNQKIKHDANKWTLGLNFVYASGQPITIPSSAYLVQPSLDSPWDIGLYPGTINRYRLPAYVRLDVSLTYKHQYRTWSIEPYLQIFNIGNRKNVWFIDYDYKNGKSEIETVRMFPLIPTLGVNIKF
jgi:hypothetical protein